MNASIARRGAVLLVAVLSLACVAACNEQSPPPPAARFDRPNRVGFLCALDGEVVVPLDTCSEPLKKKGDPIPMMFALVTQAGRGEIAAVNLTRRRVLDTRREIPGFTYQPVGEAPASVVVPTEHPTYTYIASFGGRDLRVVRTRTLIATVDEPAVAQTVALALPETGERVSPTSMVIAPDEGESALILGLPELGKLLVLPITRCAESATDCEDGLIDEAGIRSVDLASSAGRIAEPAPMEPARYQRLCDYERAELPRATSPAMATGALDATPRPSAITVDPYCAPGVTCTGRILVADDALPLVHVLDVAALIAGDDPIRAPLVTGVPTTALAVTPFVPRALDDPNGSTQYVYAVDATDGSVMVLEGGFVLEVNDDPMLRPDRIALGAARSPTRALTVLTPTFGVKKDDSPQQYVSPRMADEDDPPSNLLCRDQLHVEDEPARLRGVFLAAATAEGLIDIVDVHDMELLPATKGKDACRACPPDQHIPLVVRHHRRLATSFSGEDAPDFTPELRQLLFQFEGLSYQVRADGTTASPAAPGLNCMACGEGRVRVYPTVDPEQSTPSDAGGVDGGDAGGMDAGVDAAMPTARTPPAIVDDPYGYGIGAGTTLDGGLDAAVPTDELVVSTCDPEEPALVCASNDPWSTPEENFTALYESPLPGALSLSGSFVRPDEAGNRTGGLELLIDVDPCTLGVLGEDDMKLEHSGCPLTEPENDPKTATETMPATPLDGDQVVLASRPLGKAAVEARLAGEPDAERIAERCQELADALADDELPALVAFEIRRAYDDRLVLRTKLVDDVGKIGTFDELADCYEAPFSFDIRTLRAFTITGAGSGFAHRVRTNAAGRCQVDESLDPLLQGRARLGCTFENHAIELRFGANGRTRHDDPPPRGTRFDVFVISRARKLFFDARQVGFSPAAVVATDLAWNPIDERLYLVDMSDRGLLPIPVDPFPSALSTRYQFR